MLNIHKLALSLTLVLLFGVCGVTWAANDVDDTSSDSPSATEQDWTQLDDDEEELVSALVERLNAARPDILLVGMGTPLQERWVAVHRHELDLQRNVVDPRYDLLDRVPLVVDRHHHRQLPRTPDRAAHPALSSTSPDSVRTGGTRSAPRSASERNSRRTSQITW